MGWKIATVALAVLLVAVVVVGATQLVSTRSQVHALQQKLATVQSQEANKVANVRAADSRQLASVEGVDAAKLSFADRQLQIETAIANAESSSPASNLSSSFSSLSPRYSTVNYLIRPTNYLGQPRPTGKKSDS